MLLHTVSDNCLKAEKIEKITQQTLCNVLTVENRRCISKIGLVRGLVRNSKFARNFFLINI